MHSNGSPLLVAQRSNSTTDQLMRPPFRKPDAGPPPRSAVGFLLLDGSLRPIVFNAEAIRVVSYPDPPANVRRPDVFLAGKIRESLLSPQPASESRPVNEFRSGRRRYLCRPFAVDPEASGPWRTAGAGRVDRA